MEKGFRKNNDEWERVVMDKKMQYELTYWEGLLKKHTEHCKNDSERNEVLMSICYNITYPRYRDDLYLNESSFIGKRVLDLGCGPHGGLIGFIDCEKHGVDHLIEEYKKLGYPLDKHNINYIDSKSEKIPFDDSYFDVVISVNSLDHVDDVEQTFCEISRVLKPKGDFFGQFMFHDVPFLCEPICLNHEVISSLCERNKLMIKDFKYQQDCETRKESIHYYNMCKNE